MRIKTGRLCATRKGRIPQSFILETILAEIHRACQNPLVPLEIRQRLWQASFLATTGSTKSNDYENELMKLLFNAVAIANVADNAASAPLTNLAVALHTADPGEAGDQTTSETSYTGYARVSVLRTTGGWTVTGNSVSPVANIDYGKCTAGPVTVTHASVGRTGGGATEIFYSGPIAPVIDIEVDDIPRLDTSTTLTED